MIHRHIHLFTVTLFIATLVQSNVSTASEQANQWRKVNDTTLQFSGEITPETERDFFLTFTEEIDTLIVTSPGGDLRAAVTVGIEIALRDMTVIVRKMCLSSCANYFLLAADTKIIESGS
ncbi:MAG: hypothetical protein Q8N14_06365, partial [Candidatus Omnitrophota bacterium]|nr:hypothetical protein [Candidatus Omnitrophota bacterium]